MGWCLPFQDLGRLVCEFDSEKDGVGAGALCSISLWGMVCQKLMERRQEGGGACRLKMVAAVIMNVRAGTVMALPASITHFVFLDLVQPQTGITRPIA